MAVLEKISAAQSALSLYDTTAGLQPQKLSEIQTNGKTPEVVALSAQHLAVAYTGNDSIDIYDLSNVYSPILVNSVYAPAAQRTRLQLIGQRFAAAVLCSGLRQHRECRLGQITRIPRGLGLDCIAISHIGVSHADPPRSMMQRGV